MTPNRSEPHYDVPAILRQYSIKVWTDGPNCSPGWIQLRCPFCGDKSNHLGYSISGGFFSCWKCGFKPLKTALEAVLGLPKDKLQEILGQYRLRPSSGSKTEDAPERINYGPLKLPTGCKEMLPIHKAYLRKRKFDPDYLEHVYNLQGTGPIGNYQHRIIAPIYYRNRLVSYQGRDITGKSQLRYKACNQEDELIPHKKLLYGIDLAVKPSVVVVEGIADAWRLGPGAVATFGIKFTIEQIKLLKPYRRRFVLFDSGEKEKQAQIQAEKLVHSLNVFGGENILITLDAGTDPGDMPQSEADALMGDCGLR